MIALRVMPFDKKKLRFIIAQQAAINPKRYFLLFGTNLVVSAVQWSGVIVLCEVSRVRTCHKL